MTNPVAYRAMGGPYDGGSIMVPGPGLELGQKWEVYAPHREPVLRTSTTAEIPAMVERQQTKLSYRLLSYRSRRVRDPRHFLVHESISDEEFTERARRYFE